MNINLFLIYDFIKELIALRHLLKDVPVVITDNFLFFTFCQFNFIYTWVFYILSKELLLFLNSSTGKKIATGSLSEYA